MRNPVFKNYQRNKTVYSAITESYKLLCIILITANKLYPKQFYAKKIMEWLECRAEYCNETDIQEAEGTYDYKIQQACEELSIDMNLCQSIVRKHSKQLLSSIAYCKQPLAIQSLSENIALAFVQLANENGLGEKRRDELMNAVLKADIDNPEEEMKKFGIKGETSLERSHLEQKIKSLKKKAVRTTLSEQKEAKEEMEWLRRYQEEVYGKR